jgi:hypothetical protein
MLNLIGLLPVAFAQKTFACLKPDYVKNIDLNKLTGDWYEQIRSKGCLYGAICDKLEIEVGESSGLFPAEGAYTFQKSN